MDISGDLTDHDAQMFFRLNTSRPVDEEWRVLRLVLNCTGGPPHLTLAAVNALVDYPGEVTTYAAGYCMGAGVLLLACGKRRAAHPAARFLAQGMCEAAEPLPPTGEPGEPLPPSGLSEAAWYNNWHDQFLKRQTAEPAATWGFLRESGRAWFGADDALAWGLIHEVRNWRAEGQ